MSETEEEKVKREAEEKAKAGTEQKGEGDSDKGDKYETTPLIERAREEREKLEAANTKKEELLNREESMMAKRALGGGSEAGQSSDVPVKTKEELAKEYIKDNFENLR